MIQIIINSISNFIVNTWEFIIFISYQLVLCGGTLLLTFYLVVKSQKAMQYLILILMIWLILEGVNSAL